MTASTTTRCGGLWIDKHRPRSLFKLDYHKEQAAKLADIVKGQDFPHLLIFGPNGAGKRTRIACLLREIYGAGSEKRRIEHKSFQAPSGKQLEITTIASNYHIELDASEAGIYDRVVIQDVIKTMAQTQQLDLATQKNFKVVVLQQADLLTRDAQHALRRTMEKYARTCRIILCAQSTTKLIPALRSRCLGIRVAAPTHDEIVEVLTSVCKKEHVEMPDQLLERIAKRCDRNLRKALLIAETCRVEGGRSQVVSDIDLPEPDWEIYLKETASMILQEQTPKRLKEVRDRVYELLAHCISPTAIFSGLLRELIKVLDTTLKPQVTELAAKFEHNMRLGSKPIFHIEAFIAKFMTVYKEHIEETMAAL